MEIPKINKKRIEELLKENKRIDGRLPTQYREIKIEKKISNKAEGSARVKIGNTEVIVGVKMDVKEPYPDHPDEGTLVTSMEFPPICEERYSPGPPQIDAIEVARIVDRGIRESNFIDWKKLCIKKGEKVWNILVDIYCINDNGNVIDASALGAITALLNARFPVYDEKNEKVKFGEFTDKKLPLTKNIPFTITFYKAGEGLFVDPSRLEEDASDARLTLSISSASGEKTIHAMQKGGITPISIEELNEILEKTEKIYDELFPKVFKLIKD